MFFCRREEKKLRRLTAKRSPGTGILQKTVEREALLRPIDDENNSVVGEPMAVLLISYKYNLQTSKADYDGFYEVIRSYRWTKLSESNYAINADEPAKAIWQRLKGYIDPDDYLVMLTFKTSSWNLKDQKLLAWLLERP